MRNLARRLRALEQQAAPPMIFVQFGRDCPGRARQLADGAPVDAATFAQQLERAGAAAVVISVRYGEGG